MQDNETGPTRQAAPRPNLDYVEGQRRHRLVQIIRDARRVLDHDGEPASPELSRLITLAVAEIAAISRMVDVNERAGEWMEMVADALSIGVWDAEPLWNEHAANPIQAEARRWQEHQRQAVRLAEPAKFFHVKLVRAEDIAATLNLTRARIREVFGTAKCAIPPIRVRTSRFTPSEAADIRALARRIGKTVEHIGDRALELSEVDFCKWVLAYELLLEPAEAIDRQRLPHMSDLQISKGMRRWGSKPGPKPRRGTLEAQIAAVAAHHRKDPRTIKRWRSNLKTMAECPRIPDSAVTVTHNYCHNVTQFPRSVTPEFSSSLSPAPGATRYGVNGVEITDQLLIEIALMPRDRKNTRKKRIAFADRELVILWWEATRSETPNKDRIRQWVSRGHWPGYVESARQWQSDQGIFARDVAVDAAVQHASQHVVEIKTNDGATRPVRGPEVYPTVSPIPFEEAEGNSSGR